MTMVELERFKEEVIKSLAESREEDILTTASLKHGTDTDSEDVDMEVLESLVRMDPFAAIPKMWPRMNDFEKSLLIRCPREKVIPKLKLNSTFQWGQILDLVVTANHDPHCFYAHVQGLNGSKTAEKLSHEMDPYYTRKDKLIINHVIHPGQYVAFWSQGDQHWRRGVVTMRIDMEEYEVFLIDYGLKVNAFMSKLRYLHIRFTQIECQAVECRLGGIVASNVKKNWTSSALNDYKNICSQGRSVFIINESLPSVHGPIPLLRIVVNRDNGDLGIIINNAMLVKGHARRAPPLTKGALDPTHSVLVRCRQELLAKVAKVREQIMAHEKADVNG